MLLFKRIEVKYVGSMKYRATKLVMESMPIEAIKIVRAETGWSLKDAKEYVDKIKISKGIKYDWEK